jgi:hypothetical protein
MMHFSKWKRSQNDCNLNSQYPNWCYEFPTSYFRQVIKQPLKQATWFIITFFNRSLYAADDCYYYADGY